MTPAAAAICATVVAAMPRSANNCIATSSMWSRRSKSSTDGRRPRGLATVDFAFMESTLIDELVNFKEGFATGLIEIRRASNGGAGGPGCGAVRQAGSGV
ncbi:hypothetical protein BCEP27_20748 [Burkholderia cepacia]